MPVLMRCQRLLKAGALLRRLAVPLNATVQNLADLKSTYRE
jgi:hypothetical protein